MIWHFYIFFVFYNFRQENSAIFSRWDELTINYIKIPQEVRKFTPMEIL